jgi:hypothetical protein
MRAPRTIVFNQTIINSIIINFQRHHAIVAPSYSYLQGILYLFNNHA